MGCNWTVDCGKAPVCGRCEHQIDTVREIPDIVVMNYLGATARRPDPTDGDGTSIPNILRRIDCARASTDRGSNPRISRDGQTCDEFDEK